MFSQSKEDVKLEWMYKGPNSTVDREEYLLGRPVDKTLEQLNEEEKQKQLGLIQQPKNHVEHECIPPSIRDYKKQQLLAEQVDIQNKLQEDPLIAIKRREEESRRQFLNNPVQLKKLQEALEAQKKLKQKKKKKKQSKKSSRADSDTDSDIDSKLAEKLRLLKKFPTKLALAAKLYNRKPAKTHKEETLDVILMHKFNALKSKLSEEDMRDVLAGKVTDSSSVSDTDDNNTSSEDEVVIRKKEKKTKKRSKKKKKKRRSESEDSSDSDKRQSKKIASRRKNRSASESSSSEDEIKRRKKRPKRDKKQEKNRKERSTSEERESSKKRAERSRSGERHRRHKRQRSTENSRRSNNETSRSRKESESSIERRQRKLTKRKKTFNTSDDEVEHHKKARKPSSPHKQKQPYKEKLSREASTSNPQHSQQSINKQKPNDSKTYLEKYRRRSSSSNPGTSRPRPSRRRTSSSEYDSESNSKRRGYGLVSADGKKLPLKMSSEKPKSTTANVTTLERKEMRPPERPTCKDLSREERERRIKEMLQNAAWRDKDREAAVKRHRESEIKEAKMSEEYNPEFLHKELLKTADSSSVESRIKANVNNIQRCSGDMNSNFSKRC